MVAFALDNGKSLDELTMDEFLSMSDIFDKDIYDAISMDTCVNERKIIGGPAREATKKAIALNEEYLKKLM